MIFMALDLQHNLLQPNPVIPGLQRLADRVYAYGTKIFLQLHHPGREGSTALNPNGAELVAPSAFTTEKCKKMPHEFNCRRS